MQKEPSPTLDRTACNCLALRQAARHVSQIYDSYVASEGLRTTQYSILAKLNRLGPLSINELAKSMVMDRTTLGRAIRPLQRDRLLTIGAGEDGRTRIVRRTLREQLGILHRHLLDLARTDGVCRRLMTVPGIGPVVALTFCASIDVPARFRNSAVERCWA